ncbi:unnamed protein product [Rotaria socialis]|uniref:RING-type domain-containing protein n=1 Tax=Rotaria socialis TaxID=392032 RepID=A0A821KAU2_9BILA|nr:unnamed protein product [Rotaria socialis]CAF3487436.1 unnamed protein product [Rotaria socialis]CAF3529594.1 unnamed protein product [Rotaria socialis]CAF3719329.1 unnamed protein product [Rotaria socialis]CAF3777369.1 unnamed protein product [Rotaria socialis]
MESLYFSLTDVNPILQCFLCKGYLVDPYTIKECMHTFCRTCILVYFENLSRSEYKCPQCNINLQPFSDISKCLIPDRQCGDMIRSLLPLLDIDEINNEKQFYEKNSLSIPKDLRLKLRLVQNVSPMRFTDNNNHIRIRSIKAKSTISSMKKATVPIAIQIELCKKYIDSSLAIKQYPKKYLCVNSQLEISHIEKYIETICQVQKPYKVYLFFYDSCLSESTPLLLIKSLLFSSTDRMKLFFSIMLNK